MGAIQKKILARVAVVDNHGKTAGGGDDALLKLLVCVASASGTGGHIVKVVHPLDSEGDVPPALNKRKISSMIGDLWEVNDADLALSCAPTGIDRWSHFHVG